MNQASEQQFQQWEKLVDEGIGRFEASRIAGTTLKRLANGDRERFEHGVALSLERQAAKAETLMAEQTSRPEPSPQLIALEAKAHHPDYADRMKIEHGGTVNHVAKVVTLGDLLDAARESGLDLAELAGRPGRSLPGPAAVLPAPSDSKAIAVPAEREA